MGSFSLFHWLVFSVIAYLIWLKIKPKPAAALTKAKTSRNRATSEPDNWEGAFWEVARPQPADSTVLLEYKDGNGQRTKRTAHVRGYDPSPKGLIIGHCTLRDATRTFRHDRIERAIDPDTGEIIQDITSWLGEKYKNSPGGMRATLAGEYIDLFKVLLYVAKADGQVHDAEVHEIAKAMTTITGNNAVDAAIVRGALQLIDTPTLHGFKLAYGRTLKANSDLAEKTRDAARNIVATKSTVHPNEQEALDYLGKATARRARAA